MKLARSNTIPDAVWRPLQDRHEVAYQRMTPEEKLRMNIRTNKVIRSWLWN